MGKTTSGVNLSEHTIKDTLADEILHQKDPN